MKNRRIYLAAALLLCIVAVAFVVALPGMGVCAPAPGGADCVVWDSTLASHFTVSPTPLNMDDIPRMVGVYIGPYQTIQYARPLTQAFSTATDEPVLICGVYMLLKPFSLREYDEYRGWHFSRTRAYVPIIFEIAP